MYTQIDDKDIEYEVDRFDAVQTWMIETWMDPQVFGKLDMWLAALCSCWYNCCKRYGLKTSLVNNTTIA